MRHIPTDFYIMKAAHMTSSGRKLGLKKIVKHEPNITIFAITREYGYGKKVDAFVTSHGGSGVKVGEELTYTIDTGNGYKMNGERLVVNDIFIVKDGVITNKTSEELKQVQNAYTWVMK